jgi:RimJ/RimL family protein N-acetyltransferase
MSFQDRGRTVPPPRLGPLAAAAWVEAAVRYWQRVIAPADRVPGLPLQVVDLAPSGDSIHLLLPALAVQASRELGFPPRLRYTACTPDGRVPPAWHGTPQLRDWLIEDRLRVLAEDELDACIDPDSPAAAYPVVLAHGAWGGSAQRLFAVHYGRLLEAVDEAMRCADGAAADSQPWKPASLPPCGAFIQRLMEGYRSRLNSAPVTWPEGAMRSMDRLIRMAFDGCLVLAMDHGFVSERQFRLCGFERFSAPEGRGVPVNFQLLEAAWRELGAALWQLGLPHEQAVQVAVIDRRGRAEELLAEAIAPLRSGAFADAAAMVRLAAVAVRQGDDSQLLALLRHSRHDPAVFLAACPALHERLLAKAGCDRAGWAAAVRRVVANHIPMPGAPRVHGHLALAAMRLAEWGLARHVLAEGTQVLGDSVEDLLALAHCESATGRLNESLACVARALALDPGHRRALELEERTHARMARWDEEWRRCLAHAELPLLLQPLDLEHAEALLHQYRDPQIAVMTGLPALTHAGAMRGWIEEHQETAGWYDYAVMHAELGLVGYVGLHVMGPAALLCFWTGIDHQGRGWAAEAARLLCAFARPRGVAWIFGEAFSDNVRSVRALQRAGFVSMDLGAGTEDDSRVFLCFELAEADRPRAIDALRACMRQLDRDIGLDPEGGVPSLAERDPA